MQTLQQSAGTIAGIYREELILDESFESLAARFADEVGTVLLLSGGDLDCARYHLLGLWPWLTLRGKGRSMQVTVREQEVTATQDPFDTLREILDAFALPDAPSNQPLAAGLMGYLAYDLKYCLEDLPRTALDDLNLPDICFYAPAVLVVHDRQLGKTTLQIPEFAGTGPAPGEWAARFHERLKMPAPGGVDSLAIKRALSRASTSRTIWQPWRLSKRTLPPGMSTR